MFIPKAMLERKQLPRYIRLMTDDWSKKKKIKSNYPSTVKVPAHVMSPNIPLAKANYMGKPKVMR